VRRALLDVDGGGIDATDLATLLELIEEADGALDYGRADLNGDGRTGPSTRAFDLNHNADFDDVVTALIDGRTKEYDESSVSDLDVLCYLAFSASLGLPGEGVESLEAACGDAATTAVSVEFPPEVQLGVGAELRVVVEVTGELVEGASVDVMATGATVPSVNGSTNADGEFVTSFQPQDTAQTLTVEVITSFDGEVISVESRTARVVAPKLAVVERDVRASATAGLYPYIADLVVNDEDRNQEHALTDEVRAATVDDSLSDMGSTSSGVASATVSVAHVVDTASGNLSSIAVVLDSDASASHSGGTGTASVGGGAFHQLTFTVSEPVDLSYDVSLSGSNANCSTSFFIVSRGATMTGAVINELHTGDEGPQSFVGETSLLAGVEYSMAVSADVAATARDEPAEASGLCHGEATFGFLPSDS